MPIEHTQTNIQTVHYIEVAQRRHSAEATLNHLTLKLIKRKALMYIKMMKQSFPVMYVWQSIVHSVAFVCACDPDTADSAAENILVQFLCFYVLLHCIIVAEIFRSELKLHSRSSALPADYITSSLWSSAIAKGLRDTLGHLNSGTNVQKNHIKKPAILQEVMMLKIDQGHRKRRDLRVFCVSLYNVQTDSLTPAEWCIVHCREMLMDSFFKFKNVIWVSWTNKQ